MLNLRFLQISIAVGIYQHQFGHREFPSHSGSGRRAHDVSDLREAHEPSAIETGAHCDHLFGNSSYLLAHGLRHLPGPKEDVHEQLARIAYAGKQESPRAAARGLSCSIQ